MRPLLIKGGRIIDPANGVDKVGNLLIIAGKISAKSPPPDCDVLDAAGMIVCPGFIDLHCHLRQPGYEAKETIASGTAAAARGGFTTVCCMPNTNPFLDNLPTLEFVRTIATKEGAVRVLPIACVTKSEKSEELTDMKSLAAAGAIGFSDDGQPVNNPKLMRQALEHSRTLGLTVIEHCEDKSLSFGGQINEGAIAARLGLKGIPASAEENIIARDIVLAEATGGWLHIAHVSTEGSVELVRRAKEKGIHITAEVTPHHLTLTEDAALGYNTNAKVNPPLRTMRDIKALIRGLKEGVIDIIATDHAPHTRTDKDCDFTRAAFGISGLETALGSLMKLVHSGEIDLAMLIARLTSEPAKIINNIKLGTLSAGAPADITIFDPDKEWAVDPEAFASKGKNTPLAGSMLKGKVMATIYGGKIVFRDETCELRR